MLYSRRTKNLQELAKIMSRNTVETDRLIIRQPFAAVARSWDLDHMSKNWGLDCKTVYWYTKQMILDLRHRRMLQRVIYITDIEILPRKSCDPHRTSHPGCIQVDP